MTKAPAPNPANGLVMRPFNLGAVMGGDGAVTPVSSEGWKDVLALDTMLKGTGTESAFLAPRSEHEFLRRVGAQVLDIDHIGLRTEMEAYGDFAPDVVIDDVSLTAGFATAFSTIPRIAI